MAQLVQRLEHRKYQAQDEQVLRRQDPAREIVRQLVPVLDRGERPPADDGKPDERANPSEKRPVPGEPAIEEPFRVEKRNLDRERREPATEPRARANAVGPAQQLVDVGCGVALHDIAEVQLPEKADHLLLGRRLVAVAFQRRVPDALHRALPVHQADDEIGARVEAVRAPRHPVLQHIPAPAAVAVPMDAEMRAQPRPQLGDAVPRRAHELLRHQQPFRATMPSSSG